MHWHSLGLFFVTAQPVDMIIARKRLFKDQHSARQCPNHSNATKTTVLTNTYATFQFKANLKGDRSTNCDTAMVFAEVGHTALPSAQPIARSNAKYTGLTPS